MQELRQRDVEGPAEPRHVLDPDPPPAALDVADRVGAPPEPLAEVPLTPPSAGTLGADVGCDHIAERDGQQKRAAEAFHAETIAALARGQYIDVTDKTTVTEYAREWVSIQPYRPSSRERRESQ